MHPKKKIAAFILLSSIGIAVLVWCNPRRSESDSAKEFFWTHKTHNDQKYDVVFYGDSRTYKGVDIKEFTEGTNVTAYNFGYSAASMSIRMLEFAESKVDVTSADACIVLGISPYEFTDNALKDKQYMQELNRPLFDVKSRLWLSPLKKYFDPIRLTDFFKQGQNVQIPQESGFMAVENVKFDTAEGLSKYVKVLSDNPIQEKTYTNFFNFVKRKSEEGIRMVAYRVPCLVSMQALEDEMTGFDEHAFARRFEANGGHWITINAAEYESYDGSHLTSESVLKLTKLLKNQVLGSME